MPNHPLVQRYEPIANALVALLHPHCEVVLHDLDSKRIIGIWGRPSGRQVGDASLLEEIEGGDLVGKVYQPYEKVALDGSRITSVSAMLPDGKGRDVAMLCINVDRTAFHRAAEVLQAFLAPSGPRPEALFRGDWREQIALEIDAFCGDHRVERHGMDRASRMELLEELDRKGLFSMKHAASHVASALGVSRASIYNHLKEIRG